MAGHPVTGDQYMSIDRKMSEIKRQLLLPGGSSLDPERVNRALQGIVEGDFEPRSTKGGSSPTAKWTVELGRYKTHEGYLNAYAKLGIKVYEWALDIARKVPLAKERIKLDLYEVSGFDLGYKEGETPTRAEIYARALVRGYVPVPAEAGLALREQYPDQPKGEYRILAMEPITGSDGCLDVFHVERVDGGLWLDSNFGLPDHEWLPEGVWVFGHGVL
jgi:hypothetical protein